MIRYLRVMLIILKIGIRIGIFCGDKLPVLPFYPTQKRRSRFGRWFPLPGRKKTAGQYAQWWL